MKKIFVFFLLFLMSYLLFSCADNTDKPEIDRINIYQTDDNYYDQYEHEFTEEDDNTIDASLLE